MIEKYDQSEFESYTPEGYNENVFVRIGMDMIEGLCERPITGNAYMVYIKRDDLTDLDKDVTIIDRRRDGLGIDVLEEHIYKKSDEE